VRDRLTQFGDAAVVVVTFARPAMAELVASRYAPLPLLVDEERAAYRAMGFERGELRAIWAPRVLGAYARLVRGGGRPSRPTEDTRQLGGDVVVGGDGRIRLLHRSADPTDRPSVDELVAAARG
jgi:hypothetical protein